VEEGYEEGFEEGARREMFKKGADWIGICSEDTVIE
jgi:hypothetical protein